MRPGHHNLDAADGSEKTHTFLKYLANLFSDINVCRSLSRVQPKTSCWTKSDMAGGFVLVEPHPFGGETLFYVGKLLKHTETCEQVDSVMGVDCS